MTKQRYKILTENMLNEYCAEWPDYDITLPSFEQAQEQEKEGVLLLESKENKEVEGIKNTSLVEGNLLENLYQSCNGACSTCFLKEKNKGENGMNDIDKMMAVAFGPNSRSESVEETGYDHVYQIINGQLVQTEQSKRDQKAYEASRKKEKPLEEAWKDLSLDEKFDAAFV